MPQLRARKKSWSWQDLIILSVRYISNRKRYLFSMKKKFSSTYDFGEIWQSHNMYTRDLMHTQWTRNLSTTQRISFTMITRVIIVDNNRRLTLASAILRFLLAAQAVFPAYVINTKGTQPGAFKTIGGNWFPRDFPYGFVCKSFIFYT